MGRNSILASDRAECPPAVVGSNRPIDGHRGARSNGTSPYVSGEIGEHHQPMRDIRDPIP